MKLLTAQIYKKALRSGTRSNLLSERPAIADIGFTLIELLIVVAIIAILAAIAIPNFLEAQTRSKVSRTLADFRSCRLALESYRVDNTAYPNDVIPPYTGSMYRDTYILFNVMTT